MITKTDLTTIRAKINNALQEIANEYDAKMSIGSMGYGGSSENITNFTTRITCEVGDYIDSTLVMALKRIGVDNPKSIFKTHSGRIQFTGYSTRSKKYPFIYQNLDNGKSYKCGYDQAELYATKEQVE
tara:strand:+ start:427 stop:810 length:384 start_codon:yes stop_codon:yes gene_type:complete